MNEFLQLWETYVSSYIDIEPGCLPRSGHIAKVQVLIYLCFNDPLFMRLEPVRLDISNYLEAFFGVSELKVGQALFEYLFVWRSHH
jgi:hypothetical protein